MLNNYKELTLNYLQKFISIVLGVLDLKEKHKCEDSEKLCKNIVEKLVE